MYRTETPANTLVATGHSLCNEGISLLNTRNPAEYLGGHCSENGLCEAARWFWPLPRSNWATLAAAHTRTAGGARRLLKSDRYSTWLTLAISRPQGIL